MCLNLLTRAVIVWNIAYRQVTLAVLQSEVYLVHEEDLAHLWPARFAYVHHYGKYEFKVEVVRAHAGLRPLRKYGDT